MSTRMPAVWQSRPETRPLSGAGSTSCGSRSGLVTRKEDDTCRVTHDAGRIQRIYLILMLGNTLAASFIWGINTLFLLDAGLSNLEAFAANAFYTVGMVLFEVPTGLVAAESGPVDGTIVDDTGVVSRAPLRAVPTEATDATPEDSDPSEPPPTPPSRGSRPVLKRVK